MQLTLKDDLPFTTITIEYRGQELSLSDVLIDTGSASTILAADWVAKIGIVPEPGDRLLMIAGIGGTEAVFTRKIDRLLVEQHGLAEFLIEVGSMNYGFEINGILGMDFLTGSRAVVDLGRLTLEFSAQ